MIKKFMIFFQSSKNQNTYDAVLIAVAHNEFKKQGLNKD
jgi:hypothetical protein